MRNASNGLELRPLDWETDIEVHEPQNEVDKLVLWSEYQQAVQRGESLWGTLRQGGVQ